MRACVWLVWWNVGVGGAALEGQEGVVRKSRQDRAFHYEEGKQLANVLHGILDPRGLGKRGSLVIQFGKSSSSSNFLEGH